VGVGGTAKKQAERQHQAATRNTLHCPTQ
jgi:hypothetical protein